MCDVDLLKLYCIKVTGFPFFSVGTWRLLVGPTTNFEFLKLGTDIQTFDLNLRKKLDRSDNGWMLFSTGKVNLSIILFII